MRDRLVLVNAARLAEVPEGTVRQSRSMTTAQARQLLDSDLTAWWRAYFSLALYCGLRPGELTGSALGRRGPRQRPDPGSAPR